jgi:peptidoglycan-N-acetylglucosamine deacetylase
LSERVTEASDGRAGVHRAGWAAGATGAALLGAHLLPSLGSIPALRNSLLPRLSGHSNTGHVALTFDDGPDPVSTPAFLDELSRLDLRATFFLLGTQLRQHPDLGARIVAEGHEVAVHGWRHRPHLLQAPWQITADLERACACVRATTGAVPQHWRPPNGVLTGTGLLAARRHALRPVLWTADGRDWTAEATPTLVFTRLARRLAAGGTILLHDSDVTSAPNSWRSGLGALPALAALCLERRWILGPLREHWSDAAPRPDHPAARRGSIS